MYIRVVYTRMGGEMHKITTSKHKKSEYVRERNLIFYYWIQQVGKTKLGWGRTLDRSNAEPCGNNFSLH